jgi:protein gp37
MKAKRVWASWNPATGCTKVSPGCAHCYAERMALRLKEMGQGKYRNGFAPTTHPDLLSLPLSWKRPRMIFVNSMGDLFHDAIPLSYIKEVFAVMEEAPRHVFQLLTKRSERLAEVTPLLPWPDNVWMGVTVENADYTSRIGDLVKTPARVRFLSVEPLLGPIDKLPLSGIHWVVVGGESGPHARPMRKEWVIAVRDQCREAGVAFFFKQWGGTNRKKSGRMLDGKIYDEMPEIARPDRQYSLI